MEDFGNDDIHEIAVMCGSQCGKTVLMMGLMAWSICEDPGPLLWVTSSLDEARKFSKSRLMHFFDSCGPVLDRMPEDRKLRQTLAIYFPGAPLIIAGANSPAGLQSTPFRYIFLDEVRQYPKGALEMVSKRTRSFRHTYKKMTISTPDRERDAMHLAYLEGNQCVWEVECPECGGLAEMKWGDLDSEVRGGLKWDVNEETQPSGGTWNMEALKETIRYECPHCPADFADTEFNRKRLARAGRWVEMSPTADPSRRSYRWSALMPWWASWEIQVAEYLTSMKAKQEGNFEPLRVHICESRGQPWTDEMRFADDEKFLQGRVADYDPLAKWEGEVRRFMTVDVQGKGGRHFWLVIRAWAYGGVSRLIHSEKVWTWDELAERAEEYRVKPNDIAVDSAAYTSEVYANVVRFGYCWKPMRGEERPNGYRHKGINYIYNVSTGDPAIGTSDEGRVRTLPLYLFSKVQSMDRLTMFMEGVAGDWQIHPNHGKEYALQATAYERRAKTDARGVETLEFCKKREDHIASCEMMQVVCAAASPDDLLAGSRREVQPELV